MDLLHSPAFAVHVHELLQQRHCPGLAIAIVQNDTVASNAFGLATLDPPCNVTADTLFDIASSSKSLTAASVGLLAVDNIIHPQLRWDTPMSQLLPDDFVMSGDGYTEQVTVEDILSHRSGFPGHDYSYLSIRAKHPDTPQSVTQNLRHLSNAAPPRTKFMYANVMYIVASWLVEKFSNLSFAEFLNQNFLEPLGMNSTYLQPNAAIDAGLRNRIATPYVWDEKAQDLKPISLIQAPEAQGCGSIFTSVNDYIKWVRAIMNKEPPISKELYEGLLKPRIEEGGSPNGPPSWYAAGLSIQDVCGFKLVGHGGLVSGFHSVFFFMPELNFGAVLLANAGDDNVRASSVANMVAIELVKEVLKTVRPNMTDCNNRKRDLFPTTARSSGALAQKLCPDGVGVHLQDEQLQAYTGRYCSTGYRCITISTKDDFLFTDATDRSLAFTARFEHVCNDTIFIAHLSDYWEGGDDEVSAKFDFANDRAVRIGIWLEEDLNDYIWFDKVASKEGAEQIVMRFEL